MTWSPANATPQCPHEHEDAAYVLGALSPEDRAAFQRHLPACRTCSAAVAELAGLPGLLARVPADVADPSQEPAPLPDTLLPALVRRVRERRRRRTVLTAALVGVAATLALGVGVAVTRDAGSVDAPSAQVTPAATAPSGPAIAPPRSMRSVGGDPVAATLSLTSVGWGTRLDLTCDERDEKSSTPVPAEWATYAMYVHTRDGRTEQVATWQALPGQVVRVSGATAADRSDITDVDVRNAGGARVLDLG